jgi:hypothetical protein
MPYPPSPGPKSPADGVPNSEIKKAAGAHKGALESLMNE